MDIEHRRSLYNKWKEACDALAFSQAESIRFKALGDQLFQDKYKDSFEVYDEVNSGNDDLELESYWEKVDDESDKVKGYEKLADELYEQMVQACPEDFLDDYASCGMIGHVDTKLVKVKFFDGVEQVGYIYSWEGDYIGSPYYFTEQHNRSSQVNYVDVGELIESVEPI